MDRMKKNLKSSIVMAVILVLFLPQFAFASDITPEGMIISDDIGKEVSVTISERDIIQELQSLSNEELRISGYSNKDIYDIRNVSDEKMLKKARMRTDEELRNRGLTEKQIDIIRNESNVVKAASETYGKVTYTVSCSSYTYYSGVTSLKVRASWKWTIMPENRFVDIIASTTSNSDFIKSSATGRVNYRIGKEGKPIAVKGLTVKTENSGTGTFARITTQNKFTDTTHPRPTTMFAFDGYITTSFKATKKISSVGISAKYGHSIVVVNPGVSFSKGSASISFSPSMSIRTGDEAYARLTL